MIRSFRHKGLERFFTNGSKAGIQAKHANRLRLILARLNATSEPRDIDLPGLDLHRLKGMRQGTWALTVSGNWRITFKFIDKDIEEVNYKDIEEVNYEDYH